MNDNSTLYERIGGASQVAQLVDSMYQRILADDELAPFFVDTPMDKQRKMQTEFFCAALDGPVNYSGMDLAAAHRGRGITRAHVTRFVDHLIEALSRFDLSEQDINEICARIGTYTNDIIGESTADG